MQRMDAPVVGDGEAGGPCRLRRNLTAEQAGSALVAARVEAAEDVAVELLEVEDPQELGDVARLRFAAIARERGVAHAEDVARVTDRSGDAARVWYTTQ